MNVVFIYTVDKIKSCHHITSSNLKFQSFRITDFIFYSFEMHSSCVFHGVG